MDYAAGSVGKMLNKREGKLPTVLCLTSLTWDTIVSLEPGQASVPLVNRGWLTQPGRVPFIEPFLNIYCLLCSGSDQTPQQDTGLQGLGRQYYKPCTCPLMTRTEATPNMHIANRNKRKNFCFGNSFSPQSSLLLKAIKNMIKWSAVSRGLIKRSVYWLCLPDSFLFIFWNQ